MLIKHTDLAVIDKKSIKLSGHVTMNTSDDLTNLFTRSDDADINTTNDINIMEDI